MRISLPDGSEAFLFGSALRCDNPGDIDVLVVYDPSHCPPAEAYDLHRPFVLQVEHRTGRWVHLTLLTKSEEATVQLARQTRAEPIPDALDRLSQGGANPTADN